MKTHRLLSLIMATALPACGSDLMEPGDLPPELRAPDISSATWERVTRDGFSFALPDGFVQLAGTPIDSDAASFARDEASLLYDYGLYTGPWENTGGLAASDVLVEWVRLGGRRAQLVSYRAAGRYVLRAWWPDVERSRHGDLHLLMQAEADTQHERRELLAVIHSVRFD